MSAAMSPCVGVGCEDSYNPELLHTQVIEPRYLFRNLSLFGTLDQVNKIKGARFLFLGASPVC